jgi:hypothetical protein
MRIVKFRICTLSSERGYYFAAEGCGLYLNETLSSGINYCEAFTKIMYNFKRFSLFGFFFTPFTHSPTLTYPRVIKTLPCCISNFSFNERASRSRHTCEFRNMFF